MVVSFHLRLPNLIMGEDVFKGDGEIAKGHPQCMIIIDCLISIQSPKNVTWGD